MLLPQLGGGLHWDTSSLYVTGLVTVAGMLGDYNLNGVVDAVDYVVWRKTLGQIGGPLAADGNGNGQIDTGDLTVWRAHFGQTAGSGAGTNVNASVPEPAALSLLMFATSCCCLWRRRTA